LRLGEGESGRPQAPPAAADHAKSRKPNARRRRSPAPGHRRCVLPDGEHSALHQ
jgi:hypothetical protein